ncbi:CPBP family intramembrane glutamic endopeptidase [Winogradskyella forsetii]|uniref:CPBP family intramembrane glutamic endopeptidase n=1 Tax=Winogradskyella forsetii TaxID=2686077 RepID=UPI0015BB83B6|nr:type II CAAX endopeptidase family protein [Winogradskyella forsetii]
MKAKLIKVLTALILPFTFIGLLMLLSTLPLRFFNVYDIGGIVITLVALGLTFIFLTKKGKSFKDVGLYLEGKTPIRFSLGFLSGSFITVVMLAIVVNFSSLEFVYSEGSSLLQVCFWLMIFFPLAFMEELIFRGYAFLEINKTVGLWPAQIILAILFAWYHDFTGATFFNQLLGPGVWALIFGIAAVWSKGLAFPIGLHMAINVVLALVGLKDERHAIWNLEYPTGTTEVLKAQTDTIGLYMQICILAIGIILTEYYRRNKRKID